MTMIRIGEIYKFTYQSKDNVMNPHSIQYGIVEEIDGDKIIIIPLNGLLGGQYFSYDVFKYRSTLIYNKNSNKAGRIISHQTSSAIYKKFLRFSRVIFKEILK